MSSAALPTDGSRDTAAGREAGRRGVQRAPYRPGWSRLTGVPVERVSAGFHHVAAGVTVRPVDLLDEAGPLALVTGQSDDLPDEPEPEEYRSRRAAPSRGSPRAREGRVAPSRAPPRACER
jgi:hypothetical protein